MARAAFHVDSDGDRLLVRGTRATRWLGALESGVLIGLAVAVAALLVTLPDMVRDAGSPDATERVGARVAAYVGLGSIVALTRAIVGGVRTDAWVADGGHRTLEFGPERHPVAVPAQEIAALRASPGPRGRWKAEVELVDGSVWTLGVTSRHRDEVESVVARARTLLGVVES